MALGRPFPGGLWVDANGLGRQSPMGLWLEDAAAALSGSLAVTLGGFTLSAVGNVAVAANASNTLSGVTLSSAAISIIASSVSIQLDAFTAEAGATSVIFANAGISLAPFVVAGTATIPIAADAGIALNTFVPLSSAAVLIQGDASITLSEVPLVATAFLGGLGPGFSQMLFELWRLAGLDTIAPMTATTSGRSAGHIVQAYAGDPSSSVTATRMDATVIPPEGIATLTDEEKTMLRELWLLAGLNASLPMVATTTSRIVSTITLDIEGDPTNSVTVTRI